MDLRRISSLTNSDVSRVNPRSIVTAQDRSNAQGTAQLGRKASPRATGPSASVAILCQGDIRRPGVAAAPDLPPGRVDDAAETTTLEGHPGVRAPRPAEVDGARGGRRPARDGAGAPLDRAVRDDVVGRVGGGGPAAGGDCAGADGDDRGLGDPRAGVLPEDEVHGALDVAVGVDLVAGLGEERVLISVPEM